MELTTTEFAGMLDQRRVVARPQQDRRTARIFAEDFDQPVDEFEFIHRPRLHGPVGSVRPHPARR